MKSIELLKDMAPGPAAALAKLIEQTDCPNPALTCIWCPYTRACAFIDVLYHDLKGVEAFEKANSPSRVFAYLVTRNDAEPFYALFPNGDGSTFTRVEYEGKSVHWVHFLEMREGIQFLLAACDMAYKIIPVFTAQPITERRHKYYEAQGISI